MAQYNRPRRLLQKIFRRRFDTMSIDPKSVKYIQYPEFRDSQRILARPSTRRLGGDWDAVSDGKLFWGSVYEPPPHDKRFMLPLKNYAFYRALQERFLNGSPWEETGWYKWLCSYSGQQPVRRYATEAQRAERFEFLDELYASCKAGDYCDDAVDRPIINIGRDGRMALEDGRHRFCVARVAGVRSMLVDINVVHTEN